jgi:hypothetical protein
MGTHSFRANVKLSSKEIMKSNISWDVMSCSLPMFQSNILHPSSGLNMLRKEKGNSQLQTKQANQQAA